LFATCLPVFPHLCAGYYFTGDGCRRDSEGYYWITGRVDDVINPSGHRIGTAEVESALVACPQVSEAAVVGFPHELKGEGIGCYVILREGFDPSADLTKLVFLQLLEFLRSLLLLLIVLLCAAFLNITFVPYSWLISLFLFLKQVLKECRAQCHWSHCYPRLHHLL
jgi:acyl-CoA synthetase (AMP-forming)/AMP-acid ligase II